MKRTKEEAAETHETLLKAALKVFSHKGFFAASLEDVAKEANVTRGAIYWHFGSKAELYNALLGKYATLSQEIVQTAAAQGGSLTDILRRVFIRLLETVATNPELRAMMEITLFKTERTPDLAASQLQRLESSRSLITGVADVMRQGIASGELRRDLDPEDLARAFMAFQNGAIYLWLFDPSSFSLQDSAPALADIFMQGILPRVGTEGR